MKIYDSIIDTIGSTPLVKISKLDKSTNVIFAKLESFNPSGSIKDRASYAMIKDALDAKKINRDTVLIEATSGNTGIGLAMCAAVLMMKLIIVMPENMSDERKKLMKAYGAQIILTPKDEGMKGAVDKAQSLLVETENSYMPSQFDNESNSKIHELTTALEIWQDTAGQVDIVAAGIGTGGTITGVARGLKAKNPDIKIIGVEPKESPLLTEGHYGVHKIQGIGANFVPKILDRSVIDEIIDIKSDDAIETARLMGKKEGIFCGISSGAVMRAVFELAQRCEYKNIVAILPDGGERYLSTELCEND